MSQARYLVADVFDGLATLPDNSVDLVLTSPPFLALRSYLPAEHPDKGKEIGSEATPGAFLDVLLDVVVELRRVLAPHGSLCVELGDTYSGSGNGPDALKEGRVGSHDLWLDESVPKRGGKGWPLAKSLCMVPQSFAFALAYGRNPWTGRTLEPWRVRNIIRWCRPNPPVGALGDKFRPATSEMVVACVGGSRYFDLDAVREPHDERYQQRRYTVQEERRGVDGKRTGKTMRGIISNGDGLAPQGNPAGAPPLDYWVIPTQPYAEAHYATWPAQLCVKPIKAMCPPFVCTACGTALGLAGDAPRTTLRGMPGTDNEPLEDADHAVLLEALRQSEHSTQPRDDQGLDSRPEGLHPHSGTAASNGKSRGLRDAASASHGRDDGALFDLGRSGASPQRGEGRQPPRESATDGQARTRPGPEASGLAHDAMPSLWRVDSGSQPCPRCGGTLRRGRVLDPFAGSGTTLEVATGHGRDAIGIDLDPRNADLARQRCGMFLTVEHPAQPVPDMAQSSTA